MLSKDALLPLLLFMALTLTAALHGLAAGGHFPRQHRTAALASGLGPIILFGSSTIVIASYGAGIVAAARLIPWYAAIIGGGLCVLAAPLVLQRLPEGFVDGRGALAGLSTASLAIAVLLIWIA